MLYHVKYPELISRWITIKEGRIIVVRNCTSCRGFLKHNRLKRGIVSHDSM